MSNQSACVLVHNRSPPPMPEPFRSHPPARGGVGNEADVDAHGHSHHNQPIKAVTTSAEYSSTSARHGRSHTNQPINKAATTSAEYSSTSARPSAPFIEGRGVKGR
eukprot:29855-Prorocentrum_minimum.AAC.2